MGGSTDDFPSMEPAIAAVAPERRFTMSEKLSLGENHRRVMSVVFRGIEQMCDEIDATFAAAPGLLRRVEDDLSARQRAKLQAMNARVREEIRRLTSEIELDPAVRSPRRTIRALLAASIVNLEESDSTRLRGYGELSREAAVKIDRELKTLAVLLEEMASTVEER
jgi:hypothetical protein